MHEPLDYNRFIRSWHVKLLTKKQYPAPDKPAESANVIWGSRWCKRLPRSWNFLCCVPWLVDRFSEGSGGGSECAQNLMSVSYWKYWLITTLLLLLIRSLVTCGVLISERYSLDLQLKVFSMWSQNDCLLPGGWCLEFQWYPESQLLLHRPFSRLLRTKPFIILQSGIHDYSVVRREYVRYSCDGRTNAKQLPPSTYHIHYM